MNKLFAFLTGIIIFFATIYYIDSVAHREILLTLRIILYTLAGLVIIGSLIALTFGSLVGHDWLMNRWAERRLKEQKADVMTIDSPHGLYVREMNKKAVWRPLHLNAATYQNGKQEGPLPEERQAWVVWTLRNAPQPIIDQARQPLALPSPEQSIPENVDLTDHVSPATASLRNIFLGIGKFPDGQVRPVRAPLSRLVHIAVAGSSGFGKSGFMDAVAYQCLNARELCQVVLLDAQGVTFTAFEDSDRLLYPIASKAEEIRTILAGLVLEMDKRTELFSQWRGVDRLDKYNQVATSPLPTIPIFFDEFGLLSDDREISRLVKKLSQGGRKFGLYLIAGAQTWYADKDIESSLRANLSTSVQFYARTKAQSRVLIGESVANEITRPGQAFCVLPGQRGLIELQAPDVSTIIEVEPVRVERPVVESRDEKFIRLVTVEGMSRSQASMEAYGKPYSGTSHVSHCRDLLGK